MATNGNGVRSSPQEDGESNGDDPPVRPTGEGVLANETSEEESASVPSQSRELVETSDSGEEARDVLSQNKEEEEPVESESVIDEAMDVDHKSSGRGNDEDVVECLQSNKEAVAGFALSLDGLATSHERSLLAHLADWRNSRFPNGDAYHDLALVCKDGVIVPTHQVLLAARSTFLQDLFKRYSFSPNQGWADGVHINKPNPGPKKSHLFQFQMLSSWV
jgi:hypothetical protein